MYNPNSRYLHIISILMENKTFIICILYINTFEWKLIYNKTTIRSGNLRVKYNFPLKLDVIMDSAPNFTYITILMENKHIVLCKGYISLENMLGNNPQEGRGQQWPIVYRARWVDR